MKFVHKTKLIIFSVTSHICVTKIVFQSQKKIGSALHLEALPI